jgi:mono/diheme cytochrome c family protein
MQDENGRTLIAIALLVAVFAAIALGQDQLTVWDRVYTVEQADRGEKLYTDTCAQCHGDGLAGIEAAPALTGLTFYDKWEGETVQALFDRMRTMPPDKPGSLTRPQTADVLAHMLRVGGYPAGETPLDSTAGALARIRLRMYRP